MPRRPPRVPRATPRRPPRALPRTPRPVPTSSLPTPRLLLAPLPTRPSRSRSTLTHLPSSDAGEQAEHLLDEAKAAASKVGEMISKEAEELQDHAKEARKRYVMPAHRSLSKGFDKSLACAKDYFKHFSSTPKYWLTTLSISMWLYLRSQRCRPGYRGLPRLPEPPARLELGPQGAGWHCDQRDRCARWPGLRHHQGRQERALST